MGVSTQSCCQSSNSLTMVSTFPQCIWKPSWKLPYPSSRNKYKKSTVLHTDKSHPSERWRQCQIWRTARSGPLSTDYVLLDQGRCPLTTNCSIRTVVHWLRTARSGPLSTDYELLIQDRCPLTTNCSIRTVVHWLRTDSQSTSNTRISTVLIFTAETRSCWLEDIIKTALLPLIWAWSCTWCKWYYHVLTLFEAWVGVVVMRPFSV